MKNYRHISELDLKEKRVFIRVDFNVPIKEENGEFRVSNDTRIVGALKTIKYVMEKGGKCILASHLGRPKGKSEKKYSMVPVGTRLGELLSTDVIVAEDCIGDGPKALSIRMRPKEILLLENLRFHEGEEKNSPDFVVALSELCDVYISDAFGTVHRDHASTVGLPRLKQEKAIGFLIEHELKYLEPLRDSPVAPFGLVMGGVKVSDKIGVLEHFIDKVQAIFIGGAMAYCFLKAKGNKIGKSLAEPEQVELASKILKMANVRNIPVYLPIDHVVTDDIINTSNISITDSTDIPDEKLGVDIGPKTLNLFSEFLAKMKTIFWNGPMGVFEEKAFSKGTFELANIIGSTKAMKLVGGGDVVSAVIKSGCEKKFDFISTGGGATLEYLEGKRLPGLEVLEKRKT